MLTHRKQRRTKTNDARKESKLCLSRMVSFFSCRPRSAAPDRWRDRCREHSDQALGVPAGRCSVDRMVRFILLAIVPTNLETHTERPLAGKLGLYALFPPPKGRSC